MYVFGPSTSSGEKTASAQVTDQPAFFFSLELIPPTSGLATVKVYDSEDSSVSGKLVLLTAVCAAGQNTLYISRNTPMAVNRGIYVSYSGTNSAYVVGYSLR